MSDEERAARKRLKDKFEQLKAMLSADQPYLGQKKVMLKQWLDKDRKVSPAEFLAGSFTLDQFIRLHQRKKRGLISQASPPLDIHSPHYLAKQKFVNIAALKSQMIFLQKIEIHNFKAIENLTINFPSYEVVSEISQTAEATHSKYEPWLMLLGENGVGKSSFLTAMALTLMGKEQLLKLKLKPKTVLRHGTTNGFVKIFHEQNREPITLKFTKNNFELSGTILPMPHVLGYGSTRLFPTRLMKEEKTTDKIKVGNLFSPDVALADSKKFILDIHRRSKTSKIYRELFDQLGLAIKDLLLLKGAEELKVLRGEVFIDYGDKTRDRLDELSDGYKSIVAVAVDIMKALWKDEKVFDEAQGIVLLDEIGTHLHPRWRMQVVKKFRNVFPGLQFIVTTHDPLCLRGLKNGEIRVFEKDENKKVFVIDDLPDSSEYRVDQLLTSPFFGLNSVVDPALEKEFNEYYSLLRKASHTDEEKTKIEELRVKLQPKLHLGGSWREELIYQAVDEVLAKSDLKTPAEFITNSQTKKTERSKPVTKSASEAKNKAEEEVKIRIRELWNQKEPT